MYNNYKQLGYAVVLQAKEDFKSALRSCVDKSAQRKTRCNAQKQLSELIDFFYSDWFLLLTNYEIDPDVLINNLIKEGLDHEQYC